jgi:hypothetical protein
MRRYRDEGVGALAAGRFTPLGGWAEDAELRCIGEKIGKRRTPARHDKVCSAREGPVFGGGGEACVASC